MAKYDITINPVILKTIKEEIKDYSIEELKNRGDDAALLLKKYASDFLTYARRYAQAIQKIQIFSKRLEEIIKKIDSQEIKNPQLLLQQEQLRNKIKEVQTKNYVTQNFLKRSMQFNERILEVITGNQNKIVVVLPNGRNSYQDVFLAEIPMEKLFTKNSGIGVSGRLSFSGELETSIYMNINKMYDNLSEYIKKVGNIGANATNYLNETYRVAVGTYNKYKPYVFWKSTTALRWSKMKIAGGKGDLAEAYASFFYQNENSQAASIFNEAHHLYDRLDYFYVEGVGYVDSVTGLLTSDIETETLSLSVKSADASLAGIVQMIDLANQIIQGKVKTREDLKNLSDFAQWDRTGEEPIRKGLRNHIEEVLDLNGITKI